MLLRSAVFTPVLRRPLPSNIAYRTKQPINGGSAHREQLIASFGREVEVSVAFHGGYEHWDGLLQTLAADAIRGFPQNRQCVDHFLAIKTCLNSPRGHCATAGTLYRSQCSAYGQKMIEPSCAGWWLTLM
jgi:hypothetical protein